MLNPLGIRTALLDDFNRVREVRVDPLRQLGEEVVAVCSTLTELDQGCGRFDPSICQSAQVVFDQL